MALIDKITQLRDDCLLSLDASHDYYSHTKSVWRLMQRMVQKGHKFTMRNLATDNTVEETELSGLAQDYVTGYLASATFQNFVSLFEQFMTGLLHAWLSENPYSLSKNELLFKSVL